MPGRRPSVKRLAMALALLLLSAAAAEAWELAGDAFLAGEVTNVTPPGPDGAVRLAFSKPLWDAYDQSWSSLGGWQKDGLGPQAIIDADPPGELYLYDASDGRDPSITTFDVPVPESGDWTMEVALRMEGPGGVAVCPRTRGRDTCFSLSGEGVATVGSDGAYQPQWTGRTPGDRYAEWRFIYLTDTGAFHLYRDGVRIVSHGDALRRADRLGLVPFSVSAIGTSSAPAKARIKRLGIARGRAQARVATGEYVSPPHDTGIPDVVYGALSWMAEVPDGCRLRLQLRSAAKPDDLERASWSGPRKDAEWYTSPGTPVNSLHYDHRWVQLRARLEGSGDSTPVLERVALAYANSTSIVSDPEALESTRRIMAGQNCTVPVELKDRYLGVLRLRDEDVNSLWRRILFRITAEDVGKLDSSIEKVDEILRRCSGPGDINLADSEVRTLEEKLDLTLFSALLQWQDILGLMGLVAAGAYMAKRRVLGHEEVEVTRGVTREGNVIKIGIKVSNKSTFTVTDVDVDLDVPEAFEVEQGSKLITLGAIKPGEFQSAIFKLIPHRCVSANIGGTVVYHDNRGARKMVEFEPVSAGSVCPFLVAVPLDPVGFKKRIAEMASDQQTIELDCDPREAVRRLVERFSGLHTVKQVVDRERHTVDLVFSGMGAYSKKYLGVWARIDLGLGVVYLTVFGEQKEMITGLISEIVDHLSQRETSADAYARGRAGGAAGAYAPARPARDAGAAGGAEAPAEGPAPAGAKGQGGREGPERLGEAEEDIFLGPEPRPP